MSESPYKRLPGRGLTWAGPSRVWQGEDHVLLVLTQGYFESYRRFFFKDIQALIVRRTHTGKLWNACWALCAAFFVLIALSLDDVAAIVMFCIALPFGIALLVNVLLGATCTFYIRTAVQNERVPALSRVRAAEAFIGRIEPFITAAQGEGPGEELAAELALFQSGQSVSTANAPPVSGS